MAECRAGRPLAEWRGGGGVVDEDVAALEGFEDVSLLDALALQTALRDRCPRLVLEVRTVQGVHRPEAAQVKQSVDAVDIGRLQLELADEEIEDFAGHRRVDLEAYHLRPALLTA